MTLAVTVPCAPLVCGDCAAGPNVAPPPGLRPRSAPGRGDTLASMLPAMRKSTALAVAATIAVAAAIMPAKADVRWRHCPAPVYGYDSYGYRYPANYRSYARRPYEYDHQYGLRRFPVAVRARSWSP